MTEIVGENEVARERISERLIKVEYLDELIALDGV